MALSDKTVLYEVLIRFDDDGKIKGAHQIKARIINDGGKVLAHIPGMAEPLDPALLDGVLSDGTVGLANEVTRLSAEIEKRDRLSAPIATSQDAPGRS